MNLLYNWSCGSKRYESELRERQLPAVTNAVDNSGNDPSRGMERYRRDLAVGGRTASCLDTGGEGPVAVFVHGLGTSSYLWRKVLSALAGDRRCIALDLPLHGRTPALPEEDFSLGALAEFTSGLGL